MAFQQKRFTSKMAAGEKCGVVNKVPDIYYARRSHRHAAPMLYFAHDVGQGH